MKRIVPKLRSFAGRLRESQTVVEQKLWMRLRSPRINATRFCRQYPIGRYLLDFCYLGANLIIEVDGRQHVEQEEADRHRTDNLRARGYRVLRFWNDEVLAGACRT